MIHLPVSLDENLLLCWWKWPILVPVLVPVLYKISFTSNSSSSLRKVNLYFNSKFSSRTETEIKSAGARITLVPALKTEPTLQGMIL